ncbi:MAG: histone deacetylase family protein [Alphaproteobacteria bacterium]
MQTLLITHPACLDHDPMDGHPECPERLKAILAAFEAEDFFYLAREHAREATRDELLRAHTAVYVDSILAMVPEPGHSPVFIDMDTALSSGSGKAMLYAAGAAAQAVDEVMAQPNTNAFCAVRPPGHHATQGTAMGFCFFNNAAVAAYHARDVHGCARVAVIDFDVHHGNGTQDIFHDDPSLFYGSVHQGHIFPGTGFPSERGADGNIVNVVLPPGAGSHDFRDAVTLGLLPALEAFRPEFLIISAGFDGHKRDPLAHLNLTEDDFAWATRTLMAVARTHCKGRIVSTLEGGYDLRALASSAAAHVRALMGA